LIDISTHLRQKSTLSKTVETVNPLNDPHWDRTLQSFRNATIFHGSAWARVLCETYGYQPVFFVMRGDNRNLGLSACMEVKGWITGSRGVALPFTDRSEPLVMENTNPDELLAAMLSYGQGRGWKSLTLHGGSNLSLSAAPGLRFYTHSLDLSPQCDRLFQALKGAVRNQVRQAERNGITVEIGCSMHLMDAYYRLHCLTRKKHGIPPQPVEFFHNIQRKLLEQEQGFVAIARAGDRPVAGSVFLHQGMQAHYKFSASDEKNLRLRGNNLVMWESICRLKAQGFTTLDFGRTSIANEGLRKYKLGWGTNESTMHYYRFDFRNNRFVANRDRANGFHNRVFRLMPMSMLQWVGKLQYRFMA
jgi:Acetyltransferase (GNAT) domain